MIFCPNKSHPVYKEMVAKLGENRAMQAYLLNRFDIPSSLKEAEEILEKNEKNIPIVPEPLVKKVKETLLKQRAIYKGEHLGTKLIQQIDTILFNLEQGNRYEGMMYLIRNANTLVTQAEARISKIKDLLTSAEYDKLSEVEKKDIAFELSQIKEFVSTYSILDDIRRNVFREKDASVLGQHGDWLNNAIQRRQDIIEDYQDLSYALTAKWLKPQMDRVNANLKKQGKDKYVLTEERLIELLKSSDTDANVITKLLGTTANSKDPVLGLVSATLKRELENNRLAQIEREHNLYQLYSNKPGSSGNQEDFNKPYYHYIENKEFVAEAGSDGKPIMVDGKPKGVWQFVKRAAFHTKLRTDLFEKNKYEFFEKLKKKYGDNKPMIGTEEYAQWTKEVSNWFKENTELVDTAALIAKKKRALSPQKFQRWLEDNTKEVDNYQYSSGVSVSDFFDPKEIYSKNKDTFRVFSGQFKQPSSLKYTNKEYARLMATDSYFSALQQEYQNANNKLHPSKKLVHGIIPQMYDESNVAFAKNPLGYIKEGARRFVNIDARDIEFGVITASGELKKYIPIHHVSLMEDVHVSKDLLRSTLIFSEMADNYKSMNDTLPSVSILTDLIKGNVKLNIDSRTTVGVKDAVTKGAWTGADAQKINNQLLEFLDKVVYGEYEIVDKIPGTNISLNKLARKAGALTAAVQLMGNITSAINNATIGNFNNIVQSIGGKYFTQGDYASATATYTSSLPSLIQDVANGVPKSKIGILAEIYDAIQGEYTDGYGRKISGSLARKLFTTDAGYFLTKATEQQIQYTGMIALLKGTKVKTSIGEMISLWDAYDEKGKLKPGVKFTEDDRFQVMQTMHKLNKEMHGVYNKFDSPTLQRRWYGKLAMMFRKHVYPSIRKRWVSEYIDMEEGDWTAGYYNIFLKKVVQSFKEKSLTAFSAATEDEKIAIKKSMFEIATFIAVNMLVYGLSGLDDDDDPVTANAELQLRRFSDDLGFYLVDVNAWMRTISSPAVSLNLVEKIQKTVGQLIVNPTETYERKTGRYNKGDLKLQKDIDELIPVVSKIYNFMDPTNTLDFMKQRALF
jgi:hypothetical protein